MHQIRQRFYVSQKVVILKAFNFCEEHNVSENNDLLSIEDNEIINKVQVIIKKSEQNVSKIFNRRRKRCNKMKVTRGLKEYKEQVISIIFVVN